MAVLINDLKDIPPLSSSARGILKIIHDEDADIDELSQIIEHDPVLLAKIIGLANSAFFGTRSVNNVHRAIIDVLGFRTTKNIVLGVVLGGLFNPRQCQSFDLSKFWLQSLMTATLAKDIVFKLKISTLDANDAYLSGMLNEIGLMALAYLYPAKMAQVLSDCEIPLCECENKHFGQNHYDFSAHFLCDWQLPEIVINVMQQSSQNQEAKCDNLCNIISFSKNLTDMICEDIPVNLAEMSLPEILSEQPHLIESIVEKASGQVDAYREMAGLLS